MLIGGARFNRLRSNASARAFLDGAGPAAIGAILGGAVLLGTAVLAALERHCVGKACRAIGVPFGLAAAAQRRISVCVGFGAR